MDNVRLAINYLIENGHKMVENNNNYAVQSIKLAIEALEKQIPKTPIVIDKWHMCPTCYEKYGFSYDILVGTKGYKSGEVHCHNCGQLINMEVKE